MFIVDEAVEALSRRQTPKVEMCLPPGDRHGNADVAAVLGHDQGLRGSKDAKVGTQRSG
jgi:hypothetical protein